jgi:N,N-dimethylformamidase beta subunit-like, C-terminal/Domain of unknown function (DUF4082)/Fibronectin type III domain/Bacterial Ig domain
MPIARRLALALVAAAAALALLPATGHAATDPCATPVTNPVACENSKPGNPPSDWDVTGIGDTSIQGFATKMSVNVGQSVSFKVDTSAPFHVDIYRLGYYGGDGARRVASNLSTTPRSQPACLTVAATGLIDCGNWGVSASWTVPSTAVSGVYIALLVRNDTGGDSQIPFVVRDDSSHSDVVLQTSDATWQAYNDYGGNSLYSCTVACPAGNPLAYKAAYAVSYNRPFDGSLATDGGFSYLWYAEYQMVRFLEENGYNVSYTAQADLDQNPALLQNHKLFVSSGHDEYWSAGERGAVESARDAGVNLAFFSGNEAFWKTRWTNSSDGSNTAYRTLVTYKETHFDSPVDPQEPSTWTGTWVDPRFSPPADGGKPQNALTGQLFEVNSGSSDIKVPASYANLRFWRNTQVAGLTGSETLTLAPGTSTLGYEWDSDEDNGFRPRGLIDMSSTTVSGVEVFTDYGSTTATGTATHHLTLYRAPSGALVFGAGTVQWAWGLDDTNAWHQSNTRPSGTPVDKNMQQATVNLFADMGVQPFALLPELGLTGASKSTDATAPTATITAPANGANLADGATATISGTAGDVGGVVAGVEVSTDGGSTWHPATGKASWTYTWAVHGSPTANIKVRATDDSGNVGTPGSGVTINVGCPCSLWSGVTPPDPDSGEPTPIEVGVKFKSDVFGTVSGIRFYKSAANTGTHVGSLWTSSGQRLAQATFSGETASGWQSVTFSSPIPVTPGTTYVASYFAPNGHYAGTSNYFYFPAPFGSTRLDSPPLHAIRANGSTANGVYDYAASSTFPTSTYHASNYWVDVVFSPSTPPGTVTNVNATAGIGSATLTWTAPSSGGPPSSYKITPYIGLTAQTPTTINGSPPATNTTINGLTGGTTYTFKVQAINGAGSGADSAPSNAVTPSSPTAPVAPTNVTAVGASGSAQVSWTQSSDGGSTVTGSTITPYLGTTAQTPVQVSGAVTSKVVTGLTNGTAYTFEVRATNTIGTSPDSAASNAVTPLQTIFDTATPTQTDSGDVNSAQLGVKFTTDTFGTVNGIRFYKAALNTGTHIGTLWSSDGTKLAQVTFTNESATGWQRADFSTPVVITPGTTYVAAYLAPNGHYSDTSPGLSTAVDNAPLHALASGTTGNGVYAYDSQPSFPASTWNATNYYVDVVFTTAAAPNAPTDVQATADLGAANVTWTAPSGSDPVTTYTVTPYVGSTAQPSTTVTGSPPVTNARIHNLTGGTAYTFKVTASNPNGASPASAASNAVTPTAGTVATAPQGVAAVPGSQSAHLSWSAPANNGGSPITGYIVTPYIGSTAQTTTTVAGSTVAATVTGLTNNMSYTFKVAATTAAGTGAQSSATNVVTPQTTIFDWTAPGTVDSGDGNPVELGVKFKSDVAGSVTGIRFHKAVANTGTHIGGLWTTTGTQLASATFTGETASGWQEVDFDTPVAIAAGTTYVAGYFAPNGHYSVGTGLGAAVDNPPLHTIPNATSPNGLYSYVFVSSFPTSSFNASNYLVDVMFRAGS